ncbi:MAG: hypothetical protein MHPSP_000189 [Paramarteilia canceri]
MTIDLSIPHKKVKSQFKSPCQKASFNISHNTESPNRKKGVRIPRKTELTRSNDLRRLQYVKKLKEKNEFETLENLISKWKNAAKLSLERLYRLDNREERFEDIQSFASSINIDYNSFDD